MKQLKVIIVNIIIVATAVASILTLYLGSFWSINLKLHVDDKNVNEVVSKMGGESGEVDVSSLGEFSITIPFSITIKNTDGINAVFTDRTEVSKKMLAREAKGIMSGLFSAAKDIFKTATNVIVNKAVDEAEKAIEEQMGEGSDAAAKLEEYGVDKEAIDSLKADLATAASVVIDGGDSDDMRSVLEESETLDKIMQAFAEAKMKEDLGTDTLTEEQKQQAAINAQEKKNEVLEQYDEVVDKYGTEDENGEKKISTESIVGGLFSQLGLKDEDGNEVKIESEEDLQNFLVKKMDGLMSGGAGYVGYGLMGLGIFVLFVMACWAYVVIKIIVKLFMRNKTIRFGLPQAFGWMPHVFFVGLPMTIIKLAPILMEKVGAQLGEQISDMVKMATGMLQLNISSLTWVSALGTVVLMVLSFFYYKWRKEIKKEVKGK